ncbi:hypothetical protein KJ855_03985 [Patescibacteria group bacterium]|nr:hypothetical protein [Patescibacteria group bacterium]
MKTKFFIILPLLFILLYPTQTLASAEYSFQWISQSSYAKLFPGETTRLWVLVENTGTITWDQNIPIHLGTDRDTDRESIFYTPTDWLSPNRPAWLTDDTVIPPGERAVFMFEITAPNQPGIYNEYFRPVVENAGWLEDYGIFWEITVTSPKAEEQLPHDPTDNYITDGIYQSELINQDTPAFTLTQGETKTLNLQIKNIGTANWYNNGPSPVRLATARDWDRNSNFYNSNWLSSNRTATINENSITPSQNGSYTLQLTAPTNAIPGIYSESFQSVAENITWFMDYDITYQITVRHGDPKYGEIIHNNTIDQFLGSGDIITITDLATQKTMKVKTLGMDRWHADVVPLTTADTQLIREIYNFHKNFVSWCPGDDWILWQPDAVTISIESDPLTRRISASMDGCAHDVDGGITDNDFPGHFDLHFYESMMHGKEETDCSFQKMVQKSAGNPNWNTYGQAEPCWNPCIGGC